jgi:hypothetical protein
VTDDPDTPGNGNWEINAAVIGIHRHERWDFAAPDLDINYGWGSRVQLKVDVNWASASDDGGKRLSGLGATDFGVKWRFVDEDRSGFALSVYPQVSTNLSASSPRRGLTSDGKELFLPLEGSMAVGAFEFDAELGRNFVQRGPDEWLGGVVVAHPVGADVEIGLELHGALAESQLGTLINLGAHWRLAPHLTLLSAAGREFGHLGAERQICLFYFGFQWTRESQGNIR